MIITEPDNCTGCMLCTTACNKNAIRMEKNKTTGFYYPVIDKELCVKCRACEMSCPENVIVKKNSSDNQSIYALISLDDKIRELCTSGGAFYLFAEEVLREGGAVAGAVYDEGLHVYHTLISKKEDIEPLLRSKYVPSDMREAFPMIKEALLDGKTVMFCGTPCQVAAVKRFGEILNKSEGLVLVDLVCRGVPSEKVQDLYLKQLYREKGSRVVKIEYKDKSLGWHKLSTKFIFENGESVVERGDEGEFFLCFPGFDLSVRESCFNCRYKSQERVSDITIGDFWGMKDPDWDDDRGTSLVLVNTSKGRKLLERISDKVRTKEFSFSEVEEANRMAFSELPDQNYMRKRFWNEIGSADFRQTVKAIIMDYREMMEARNNAERAQKKYRILLKWLDLKNNGVELIEFFKDKNINSVAVYGAGEIGILFGEELIKYDGIIKYYIDQKPRKHLKDGITMEVYAIDDPQALPVEAIVISPVLITDALEETIWKRFPGQRVYEVEEVIYYLCKKHGFDLSVWGIE